MYIEEYFWIVGALLVLGVFSFYASHKVKSTYKKYNKIPNRLGITGSQCASRLLLSRGIIDVGIGRVSGSLSDHYDPTKAVVNLSDSTYDSTSIAAVAVAAHEIGHVDQNKSGVAFYKLRTLLVPITNIGSYLAMPLVFIGLFIDSGIALTTDADIGFTIAMIGVILYGSGFLFNLVTLPVELDASRRACEMLLEQGVILEEEKDSASAVLKAAALTYLAATLTSLVYFIRFLLYVLGAFGKRNRR